MSSGPAHEILHELHRRGVAVRRDGDRIRFRPKEAVPAELLERMREHKPALLELVPAEWSPPEDLTDGLILDERTDAVAWRLYSRLLDRELWLARDERTRREIEAEHPGVPVLTFAEIPALRREPPELLAAILATKAEFAGARVLQ
jgi:hypothetical protein